MEFLPHSFIKTWLTRKLNNSLYVQLGLAQNSRPNNKNFILSMNAFIHHSPKLLVQETVGLLLKNRNAKRTKCLCAYSNWSMSRPGICPHVSHAESSVGKIIRFHIMQFVIALMPRDLDQLSLTNAVFVLIFDALSDLN